MFCRCGRRGEYSRKLSVVIARRGRSCEPGIHDHDPSLFSPSKRHSTRQQRNPNEAQTLVEESFQSPFQSILVIGFAFPNYKDPPIERFEAPFDTSVPRPICGKLGAPELMTRLRHCRLWAAFVAVPKASMDEDNLFARYENYVGPARQVCAVQSKAIAKQMSRAAD